MPGTRYSQIARLQEKRVRPDDWKQFVDRYGVTIFGCCRREGFSRQDAEDLTQEFLLSLLSGEKLKKYTPDRGSFFSWLKTCCRNRCRDIRRARNRLPPVQTGGSSLQARLAQVAAAETGPEVGAERDLQESVQQALPQLLLRRDEGCEVTNADHLKNLRMALGIGEEGPGSKRSEKPCPSWRGTVNRRARTSTGLPRLRRSRGGRPTGSGRPSSCSSSRRCPSKRWRPCSGVRRRACPKGLGLGEGGYPKFVLRPLRTTEGERLRGALHTRLPAVGPSRRACRAPGRWRDRWGLARRSGSTGRFLPVSGRRRTGG
jgi:RNA polymerase sigma factor (sigma-70 family)